MRAEIFVAAVLVIIQMAVGAPNLFKPVGKNFLLSTVTASVRKHAPKDSKMIAITHSAYSNKPLRERLIANATLIREDIIDGFECTGRGYGYYADPLNDCQIFHVCLDYHEIFPQNFTRPYVIQYSFICPQHTIFTQDAMVCAWEESAVPCSHAEELYRLNERFFEIEKIEKVEP
ncbi:uncharacterized protein LOC143037553 [Oratosquilla oratoria]|uniref:uncharacterized protein LOC143037553 n=1 Tax=Oratosquilla oratoria TaxID=337810 RepID=UPI003F75C6A4